jgi:hypothetical protein
VRLELEGLGLDDVGRYRCHSLLGKGWRLRQMRLKVADPIPWNATWGPGAPATVCQSSPNSTSLLMSHQDVPPDDYRWVWEWDGPEDKAPLERILVEEPLGPYERKLLLLNNGKDIFHTVMGKNKTAQSKGFVIAVVRRTRLSPTDICSLMPPSLYYVIYLSTLSLISVSISRHRNRS